MNKGLISLVNYMNCVLVVCACMCDLYLIIVIFRKLNIIIKEACICVVSFFTVHVHAKLCCVRTKCTSFDN